MPVQVESTKYGGWQNNLRVTNGVIDLVVTGEVGPRVIRLGFAGERNLFKEFPDQLGGKGETKWMVRGGHRFWASPEDPIVTYELDNEPVALRRIAGGLRAVQPVGPLSGLQKTMNIRMADKRNVVCVEHVLTNRSRKTVAAAPWALSVMAPGGMAIIPLPEKTPHPKRLTHNQQWSIWSYTDFADGRWTIGSRYVFFRQNPRRGPGKIGMLHREGWVAYQLGEYVFVKQFDYIEGANYPDGGMNFETFSNQDMLEVESLGPLVALKPGRSIRHTECWQLFKGVRPIRTEADADKHIRPLAE